MREYNFDGLVGPTHNYAALSPGNVASMRHGGQTSSPRDAALQGLAKMKFVHALGVGQAVLPPQPRPHLATLRRLGFVGPDEQVLARAAKEEHQLLRLVTSGSCMWTANAATVAPSCDTADGRLHFTPANLRFMFHRSIEAGTTKTVLSTIFADPRHFIVHEPLPGGIHFADEGAANHTRLFSSPETAAHILAWGRRAFGDAAAPRRFPARQTFEASRAVARLHQLPPARTFFPQQHPDGIDAGAFHTDVLAIGNGTLLLVHELAFLDLPGLTTSLRATLGEDLAIVIATEKELPCGDAVSGYPFNSQLLLLPDGKMAIVAPVDSRESSTCRSFLERVVAEDNPVSQLHYLDLRQSMRNGGGPACLRLRVPMTDEEVRAVAANVFFTDELYDLLVRWVENHYRDRLSVSDLEDPKLHRESMTALDELTQILRLGSIYDFQ